TCLHFHQNIARYTPAAAAWAAQGQGGTSGAPKDTAVALKLHSVLWTPHVPAVISFFCPCQRTACHAPNPHNNLSWHRHRPPPPVPSAVSPWPVPPLQIPLLSFHGFFRSGWRRGVFRKQL